MVEDAHDDYTFSGDELAHAPFPNSEHHGNVSYLLEKVIYLFGKSLEFSEGNETIIVIPNSTDAITTINRNSNSSLSLEGWQ